MDRGFELPVQHPLRTAAARQVGITRDELRGQLWRSPFRGVHVWSALTPDAPEQRIREAAALLPVDGAVTGWAAGYLLGAQSFDGAQQTDADSRDGSPRPQPVPLLLPEHLHLQRRAEIRVIRSVLPADEIQVVDGVRVTCPLRTALEAMRWTDLTDAVIAADALAFAGLASLPELAAYVAAHRRWRYVSRARRALELADARAESPMETRLRLLWRGTGLPTPKVNVGLRHRPTGDFLARPDLFDADAALAVEYDGGHHRAPDRHRADNLREERLERCGITVLRFDAYDLLARPQLTTARIRDGRARGLARDRGRDAWVMSTA